LQEEIKKQEEEIKINREDIDILNKIIRKGSISKVYFEIKEEMRKREKEIEKIKIEDLINEDYVIKKHVLQAQINILNWVLDIIKREW